MEQNKKSLKNKYLLFTSIEQAQKIFFHKCNLTVAPKDKTNIDGKA